MSRRFTDDTRPDVPTDYQNGSGRVRLPHTLASQDSFTSLLGAEDASTPQSPPTNLTQPGSPQSPQAAALFTGSPVVGSPNAAAPGSPGPFASGLAYVQAAAASPGYSPSQIVRSPSRLRYSYSSVRVPSPATTAAAPAPGPRAGGLPKFIKVEHVDHGDVDQQDDIQIEHQEADEHKRRADVDQKIIKQVDDLVEYFNELYHDDQINIEDLELELHNRAVELDQRDEIIRRLMAERDPYTAAAAMKLPTQDEQPYIMPASAGERPLVLLPPFNPHAGYTGWRHWMKVLESYHRNRRCWLWSLPLLLLLLTAILLGVLLGRRNQPQPQLPAFSYTPEIISAGNTSMNLQLALSQAATVYYVIIPSSSATSASRGLKQSSDSTGSSSWQSIGADKVVQAAAAQGQTEVEAAAVACGSYIVPKDHQNYTLSITSVTSLECSQLAADALAASGSSSISCTRCPRLQPSASYDVLMVAQNDHTSDVLRFVAGTAAPWSSRAPVLLPSPAAVSAGEASFKLTFSMDQPGTLNYLVLYKSLFARFLDTYVVFDNQVADAQGLLMKDRGAFKSGLVARGKVATTQGNLNYSCNIGASPSGDGSTVCSCSPAASCTVENGCFGSLCQWSTSALAPNTSYKVVVLPQSPDGSWYGAPMEAPAFTTDVSSTPPQPSRGVGISPAIGPDAISVQNVAQDKPGHVYMIITQPKVETTNVIAGTATAFVNVPGSRRIRRGRALLQANNLTILPPEATAGRSGDAFKPPCSQRAPCDLSFAISTYVNPAAETLVSAKCVPVAEINQPGTNLMINKLSNDTLYRIQMVPTDLQDNADLWVALVRTQDLTPPVLTVVDKPPEGFTNFSVVVSINEAGTIYAGLTLASSYNSGEVTANVSCPPGFQGSLLTQAAQDTNASVPVTFSFDSGITPNTDYIILLIAHDLVGNCQRNFTYIPRHTADNIPPQTLMFTVTNIGGTTADVNLQLDEPGTVFYMVMEAGTGACPLSAPDQLYSLTVPAGAAVPLNGTGSVDIPTTAPAVLHLQNLKSQTEYRICSIAYDATQVHNKQALGQERLFTTLDITPPTLSIAVLPGADGGVTCERVTYTCSVTFNTTLNEPGFVRWVLLPNASPPAVLPTPQAMISTDNQTDMYPAIIATANNSALVTSTSVTALPSMPANTTDYAIYGAARDTAGNVVSYLTNVTFVVPDITPPHFLANNVTNVTDTSVTVSVVVDEPSRVYCVVVDSRSQFPSVAQVIAGQNASTAAAVAAGTTTAATNTTTPLTVVGLTRGTYYDVYLVAVDAAGNQQTAVTNISRLRTSDSVPPVVASLSAAFTPPMTFSITASVDKPGQLVYIARKTTDPAPTAAQVLNAAASQNPAQANFTGLLSVSVANTPVSSGTCVADADTMTIYAVAQDLEGAFPGRVPNNSTLTTTAVALVPANSSQSCAPQLFLQPLRTSLSFDPSGPGLPLGLMTTQSAATGVTWQQKTGAFMRQSPNKPVLLSVKAAGMMLPGGISYTVTPLPAASVSFIIASTTLIPESNTQTGQTLMISYQLKDAAGRTQVNASQLFVRPVLSYGSSVTRPSGTTAAGNVLPDCDVSLLDAVSGIGECAVLISSKYFPTSGILTASIVLKVLVGSSPVAASSPSALYLWSPPATIPFAPSSPGLLITLPYRFIQHGETIKVTLSAANPTTVGLTGFMVPLRYNNLILEYQYASTPGLWLPVSVTNAGVPGDYSVQMLQVSTRSPGQADALYRASSSIPLLDVYFKVKQIIPGTYTGVLSLNGPASLYPSNQIPAVQFNDYKGGAQTTGSINITTTKDLGLWAWSDAYDVFNTAVLSGSDVSAKLSAAVVKSFSSPAAVPVSPDSCSVAGAGGSVMTLDTAACQLWVRSWNTAPAKSLTVTVVSGSLSAQVSVSIWFPTSIAVTAEDPILNKVLPINAATPSPASCTDMYQASRLRASADWSNGGSGAVDAVKATDVTGLVSFTSNNTNVAQVLGNVVKGVAAGGPVLVSINNYPQPPSTLITVSDAPVCLQHLDPLATTGIRFAGSTPTPSPSDNPSLSWVPAQDLVWEQSSAYVLTYATFSDGNVMDVSRSSYVTAAVPAGVSTPLPFNLTADPVYGLPYVDVNVTVGAAAVCQPYLSAAWSVCSIPLGSGAGNVKINLPLPKAVANFTIRPAVITSALNPAALDPIRLPTLAATSLFVLFTDGSVRDFSADARTSYTVTAGASLCQITQGAAGWQVSVQDTAWDRSGSCTITADVTFTAGVTNLTATAIVGVTTLQALNTYALSVNALKLPSTQASQLPQPVSGSLTLLKCDARNYDQRTLWSLALLSNCSSTPGSSCPLVDLNNRAYLNMSSADTSIIKVMTGFPSNAYYPTYPDLDNRLVPFTAGSAALSVSYGQVVNSITVAVQDTYQPTWPQADNFQDTSVMLYANMTTPYTVVYWAQPAAMFNLAADPPTAAAVEAAGTTLLLDASRGPSFMSTNATGLLPGTNYTVLMAVRSGLTLSPGVTALTGVLIPDNHPPDFGVVKLSGDPTIDAANWRFTAKLDITISEKGVVNYAVYGAPSCITADPSVQELKVGRNLADVGKCICTAAYCAAVSWGIIALNSSSTHDVVAISGSLPLSPYLNLKGAQDTDLQCQDPPYTVSTYASTQHAIYLLAEDDLPTYKGWTTTCSSAVTDQTIAPYPCDPVTYAPCVNTPPAIENNNPQAVPAAGYNSVDLLNANAPTPPAGTPLKAVINVVDPTPLEFTVKHLSGSASTITFTFAMNKPGLVRYQLVIQTTIVIAWGHYPADEARRNYTISLSRACSGAGLTQATSYGMWYNGTDIYGTSTPHMLLELRLN